MNIFTNIRNVFCCCYCLKEQNIIESTDSNHQDILKSTNSNNEDNSDSISSSFNNLPILVTSETILNHNSSDEDSIGGCEDLFDAKIESDNKLSNNSLTVYNEEDENSLYIQTDNLEKLSKMVLKVSEMIEDRLYTFSYENQEFIKYYILEDAFLLKKDNIHILGIHESKKQDNFVIVTLDKHNLLPLLEAGIVSYIYVYVLPEDNTLEDNERRYKVLNLSEKDHVHTINEFIKKIIEEDNDNGHLKELYNYILTIEQKESYTTKL